MPLDNLALWNSLYILYKCSRWNSFQNDSVTIPVKHKLLDSLSLIFSVRLLLLIVIHKHAVFYIPKIKIFFFLHYNFFFQKSMCAFILAAGRKYITQEWKNTETWSVSQYPYPAFLPLYILTQDFTKSCSPKFSFVSHCRCPTMSLSGAFVSSYLMDQYVLQQYSLNEQLEKWHTCSAGELPVNWCSTVHFSDAEHSQSSTCSLLS